MGQPPSNELLDDRLEKLRKDFDDFKKETRKDLRELDDKVDRNAAVTAKVDQAMDYMRENLDEMKRMMTGFTEIVKDQNARNDENMRKQGEKIDEFINSDKRAQAKKDLIVAVLTAIGSVVVAVITLWASGKF